MSDQDSPAQRYAASRARQAAARTKLAAYAGGLDIELDDFQVAGCRALEEGRGVLVAAPTGAGKTVVGEFACYLALGSGRKAFYTTPIKALSNQKYADLVAVHGADQVGLLTGDQSVNADAPVVVMTTEVLRNMLYANSRALTGLGYVVMDEVHYLADRFRGGVWEEVIMHLDPGVQVVSLSATVSNAEEFGAWLEEVRGDTAIVVSEHRPVPLEHHVAIGERSGVVLLDLYAQHVDQGDPGSNPPINPQIVPALRSAPITPAGGRGDRGYRGRGGRRVSVAAPRRSPSRLAVVRELDAAGMLPAIWFVFSRAGCDAGVRHLVTAGLQLTRPGEVDQIRSVIAARTAHVDGADLEALGFRSWALALEYGIAAHHAGMLPVFKETVEELFTRGLVKVVFATETLALGINMPARSVILDKLVKWNGTAHVAITAGEYTQLTGRAGRRGIDIKGHALVVDHPGMDPLQVAGLASRRTYPLRSSFTPTSNMAVNLVDRLTVTRARAVLEMSFAQFQADRGVVGLARQAQAQTQALAGYSEAMSCERGDFGAYIDLRRQLTDAERDYSARTRSARRSQADALIQQLVPGDVVARAGRYVLVLGPAPTGGLAILTAQGRVKTLTPADLSDTDAPATHLRIPAKFTARAPAARRALAAQLQAATDMLAPARARRTLPTGENEHITSLRSELRAHPCHACPDRDEHARWAARHATLTKEHATLTRKIAGRTGSIARDFDRINAVLVTLGYMDNSSGQVTVTDEGRWLGRLYAENDLLIAQCVRTGSWDQLDSAGLAAAVCAVVYSGRGDHAPVNVPGPLTGAIEETIRAWSHLDDLRIDHRLPGLGPLDLTLVAPMWRWARGAALGAVLKEADLAAGDFVRWCKQVVDVLDQLAGAAPDPAMRRTASAAIAAVRRGVVALVAE